MTDDSVLLPLTCPISATLGNNKNLSCHHGAELVSRLLHGPLVPDPCVDGIPPIDCPLPFILETDSRNLIFVVNGDSSTLMEKYDEFLVMHRADFPEGFFARAWDSGYYVALGIQGLSILLDVLESNQDERPKYKVVPVHRFNLVPMLEVAAAYMKAKGPIDAFRALQKLPLPPFDPSYTAEYGAYALSAGEGEVAEAAFEHAAEQSRLRRHLPMDAPNSGQASISIASVELPHLQEAVEKRRKELSDNPDISDDEVAIRAGTMTGALEAALIELPEEYHDNLKVFHETIPSIFRKWLRGQFGERPSYQDELEAIYRASRTRARDAPNQNSTLGQLLRIGEVLLETDEIDLAISSLKSAEQCDDEDVKYAASECLGRALMTSDPTQAKSYFANALNGSQSRTVARAYLGLALLASAQGNTVEYAEYLTKSAAIGSEKGSPEALYLLAIEEGERGNNDRYETYLSQLSRQNFGATTKAASVALAQIYFDRGDLRNAYNLAMKASDSLDIPILMGSMFYRGLALAIWDRLDEAEPLLKAVASIPNELSEYAKRWLSRFGKDTL